MKRNIHGKGTIYMGEIKFMCQYFGEYMIETLYTCIWPKFNMHVSIC